MWAFGVVVIVIVGVSWSRDKQVNPRRSRNVQNVRTTLQADDWRVFKSQKHAMDTPPFLPLNTRCSDTSCKAVEDIECARVVAILAGGSLCVVQYSAWMAQQACFSSLRPLLSLPSSSFPSTGFPFFRFIFTSCLANPPTPHSLPALDLAGFLQHSTPWVINCAACCGREAPNVSRPTTTRAREQVGSARPGGRCRNRRGGLCSGVPDRPVGMRGSGCRYSFKPLYGVHALPSPPLAPSPF